MAALSGCAVDRATPDGITITVNALHPEYAQYEATQHCRQFGKKAVLVKTVPAAPTPATLFTNSVVTTFECVAPSLPDGVSQ